MLSHRLAWHAPMNPLSDLAARKRARGEPMLDLTESNPTHAGIVFPPLLFDDPRMMSYHPAPFGLPEAREAIAAEYGVEVDRVILTSSTSEAYSWLFKLLCDPGDEVLAPVPSYPLFEYLAALESVRVKPYSLRYHEGWFVDLDAIEITQRTKAIITVNPNNPTGSFLKPYELEGLLNLARRNDLAIISDEVFSDYALREGGIRTLARVEGATVFCLNGLSKLIGMPQMKLGWILANDPCAREGLELIADTYLPVSAPVQYGLSKLLGMKAGVQRQILERVRRNLSKVPQSLEVEGGWNAILRAPRTRTEEQWCLSLLDECGVLVQPGYFYDFEAEAFLVVSLLTRPEIFDEGIARLTSLLQTSRFDPPFPL